jgi:nucleotide-binding universal stress UspA family protein
MDTGIEKTGVIVVGVDGSESVDALQWAAAQAKLAHASLEVITAWEWPTYWGREPEGPPGWEPEEQARKMLSEVVESVLGPHHSLEVRHVVVEGHPAPVLIAAAEHADLLVVGSHGHGGFADMLLGSVSMHCVIQARCPVVVVHPRSAGVE